MCGINGIFAFHVAANLPRDSELLASRDFMRARGPDGAGEWRSACGRCALAHRRLSIIDLSDRAAQPMNFGNGRFTIVYNGEIYNYPELRAELQRSGAIFSTTSDTEVLLHLYAREGREMMRRLRGMFAFAIWDADKRGIFLARDPYGIKPLYTANDGWTFRFASQVKALLAGGELSREPEPAGVVGFTLFGSVPEPFTLYRDIRALPAGHTQWVDRGGPREPEPYFSFSRTLAEGARRPADRRQIAAAIRAAVVESVRAHLVADVEVGIFLSAGIDSGALTGLMCQAGQRKTRAVTLAFEEFRGTSEDEAPLAANVARRYGAEHIVRWVSEREFRYDLPAIIAAMDQPSIDGVNTWFVAKAAREAGLKVAISGLGGDELLAGYPGFVDLPRWRRRTRFISAIPGVGRATREVFQRFGPGIMRRKPKAAGFLEYANSWAGLYLLRRAVFLPFELSGLIDPDLLRVGLNRLRPVQRLASYVRPDPGTDIGRVCALESQHYLRNQLLRDADWAGMAHSIEIRTPLVDVDLLRTLAPVTARLRPGEGKLALARSPDVPLPDEIVSRAKTGFGVPTGQWMDAAAPAAVRDYGNKGAHSRRWSQFVLQQQHSFEKAFAAA